MKTTIKSTLYILLAILVFQSCQEETEYTLKEYNPIGGIIDSDFTFSTDKYLDTTIEEVSLNFNAQRLGDKTAGYTLSIESVEPISLVDAFTLTTAQVSLSDNTKSSVVGNINWSFLDPGENVKVTIKCEGSETTDINYNGQSVTIDFAKTEAPVFELGNDVLEALIPMGESGTLEKVFTLTVLDKPLEEDIDIALDWYPEGLTRGVDFDIDTLIHIASGQTDGIVNLKVYGDQFSDGQQVTIYLESNTVPAGKTLSLGPNNWVGFTIGKAGDNIWLDYDETYDALMDQSFVGNQKITLTIQMLSSPATQDIAMPFRLNEYYLQENTHFIIPDKVARIATGETEFELEIYVIGDAFLSGESNSLWIEIYQADVPADQVLIVDSDYYWTTLNVGRE